MTDFENAFSRLKIARRAAGFKSAKDFCEKHNIPTSTYSLHETGGRTIKFKTAEKYGKILSINPAWLLTGTGEPYPTLKEATTITPEDFEKMLGYNDNEKTTATQVNHHGNPLVQVYPPVFIKIVIKLLEVTTSLNHKQSDKEITEKTVEIYQDISNISNNPTTQLTMIDLAITTYHRELIKKIEKNKKDN